LPREALNFAYERQRHVGFVGRAALLAQLDQQLIEEPAQRWVVVTGGPGMGKSAVLAAWLARHEAAGEMVPHHFIRRGWANWDDPEAIVDSLVAQLEARASEAREPESSTSAARTSSTAPASATGAPPPPERVEVAAAAISKPLHRQGAGPVSLVSS